MTIDPESFRVENKTVLKTKYQMLELLDRGSNGEVYKIRERATGRFRVVKVISKKVCQMTDNFSDEINILKKLVAHQNIRA